MISTIIHTFPGVYDDNNLRNNFATGIVTPVAPSAPQVATPVIQPPPGSYIGVIINVTIACSTPGATIYYTIDGTPPKQSSPVYSGQFAVSGSTTVQAFATLDGYINSALTEAVYMLTSPQIQVSPYIMDFGTISFLNTANAAFTITNVGTAPLIGAGNVFGNNAFFITSGTNYNLAPGVSQPFNVEFAPHVGSSTFVAFGTFTGGGGTGATGLLTGHTSIPAPIIQVTPTFLDFGTQTTGTSSANLTVTNVGDATLAGSPSIASGVDVYFSSGSVYSLAPGANQVDVVNFVPNVLRPNASTTAIFSGGGGQNVPIFAEAGTIPSTLRIGLKSYWTLDEAGPGTRLDSFGLHNLADKTSTLGSVAAIINKGAGQFGQTAISAGLWAADNSDFSSGAGKSFTITAWVFSTGGATNRSTIGKWSTTLGTQEYLLYTNASGVGDYYYWASFIENGTAQVDINPVGDSNFHEISGGWRFLAFGYDSVNKVGFLKTINTNLLGLVRAYTVPCNNIIGTPSDFVLGNNSAYNFAWWGDLDEVGLWNRVLTDVELQKIWNNNNGLPFSSF